MAFLLGVFVSLLDLTGVAAMLRHALWASAVRLVCAGVRIPLGIIVVRNPLRAREMLVERLSGSATRHRSRPIARLHQHLLNLLLVVLGLAWVGLGSFNLVQGLSDIA